jgi:hypothetical protein
MGIHWENGGYSAEVEISLIVDGQEYPVAQIGPHSFILRTPQAVKLGYAKIITCIDGRKTEKDVILHAADPSESEVAYA